MGPQWFVKVKCFNLNNLLYFESNSEPPNLESDSEPPNLESDSAPPPLESNSEPPPLKRNLTKNKFQFYKHSQDSIFLKYN